MDLDWRVKNEKLSIHLMVEEVVEVELLRTPEM
jgi:hypothetical protein